MARLLNPLVLTLFAALLLFPGSAHPAMTAREFIDLPLAKEKLSIMEPYVAEYAQRGYRNVPNAYELTARMELTIRNQKLYEKWLDVLALTAAKELGMHK